MPVETLALTAAVLFCTYAVFGLTGFGSTALSVPLLVHVVPLRYLVPMLAVLDIVAALLVSGRAREGVRKDELLRLVPFMLAGLAVGLTLLIGLPEQPLVIVLGVFLVAYASYGLLRRGGPLALSARWSAPFGFASGAFGALFGNGGTILALYLGGRLHAKNELRATSAAMVLLNAAIRVAMFGAAGLLGQPDLLFSAAILVLPALGGLYVGNRLHAVVSATRVLQAVYLVAAAAGVSLFVRALVLQS
jgi:uncharacterized membrane protein YfcA